MTKSKTLRQQLYAAIKDTFIPFLESESFEKQQDSNHAFIPLHRRRLDGGFDLIEIQFDKWSRPFFFVNFAIVPADGVHFPGGENVRAEDAHVYHTHLRGRLRVKGGASVRHGATLWNRIRYRGNVAQKCVEACIDQYAHLVTWYNDQDLTKYIDIVDFSDVVKAAD